MKHAADSIDLCQTPAENRVLYSGFKGWMIKLGNPGRIWICVVPKRFVQHSLIARSLARSEDKLMLCADGCDESTSWDDHATKLPFPKP